MQYVSESLAEGTPCGGDTYTNLALLFSYVISGPPFATGLPHYGHILAGSIKVRSHDSFRTSCSNGNGTSRVCEGMAVFILLTWSRIAFIRSRVDIVYHCCDICLWALLQQMVWF